MKEILEESFGKEISKKNTILTLWENQHPVMYWWFAFTSLSLCSVYAMLLTKL